MTLHLNHDYRAERARFHFQQSLFYATQACTVMHWGKLSDRIGRKPVILTGLFGLALSMYCFALSKTFLGFVLRCDPTFCLEDVRANGSLAAL